MTESSVWRNRDGNMEQFEKEVTEDNRFDTVLSKVGTNGRFQKKFNFLFNFLLVTASSMPYLNIVMILAIPDHWCHVPGMEETNFTLDQWKELTLPKETDSRGRPSFDKCKMFNRTLDQIISGRFADPVEEISCQYGWDYDRTWYSETASSQEDWVCEQEITITNAFAFSRIGDVLGTFTFGQMGDLVGRRPVFFMTLIIIVLGRTATAFTSHDYRLFFASMWFGSLASTAVFQAPLIVAMEISEEQSRAHIAMMQCLGWTIALCILPMTFWVVRDWSTFMLVTTLPCLVFLFPGKTMIESPRWLANRGKVKACLSQLRIVAEGNGTTVPEDAVEILGGTSRKPESGYGLISLFSSWRLAKNTLMLIISWINGALIYYVIVLNTNFLGGNPFLNFLAQGIAELPAYILGKFCCDKIGRRFTQVLGFILTIISCIPLCVLISDPSFTIVISGLCAWMKFCISLAFYACNLQTLEIYPTCVRQSGLSLGALSAGAFGILGPYIVYLGTNYDAKYTYIVVILLSCSAVVAVSFLPETLHQKLPETLAEAQTFGAGQPFFRLPKKPKKKEDPLLK